MTHSTVDGPKRHDTLTGMTGRSGRGTARQTIRMDEALWEKLGEAADRADTDRSVILRDFARWYTHEKGAKLPRRPTPPTGEAPE